MTLVDAPKLADLGRDPDVVKNLICDWSTAELRLEIAQDWIERTQKLGIWGVYDRDGVFDVPDRFVGICAAEDPLSRGGLGPEIFYAFYKQAWGKGVASEAVSAVVAHLFDDQGAEAVEALVLAGLNPASSRLLEKLGMEYMGRYSLAEYVGDEYAATIRYEVWRVETAAAQNVRRTLQEAAYKIGQFVTAGVATKSDMVAALEEACIANDQMASMGAQTLSESIIQYLEAGMKETGWLHYRVARDGFNMRATDKH